jgi:hypothetical protein
VREQKRCESNENKKERTKRRKKGGKTNRYCLSFFLFPLPQSVFFFSSNKKLSLNDHDIFAKNKKENLPSILLHLLIKAFLELNLQAKHFDFGHTNTVRIIKANCSGVAELLPRLNEQNFR